MFTNVEAKLETDSMSPRRHGGIREGWRHAIPLGIRRAYTFSRKRRKYCAATNKNMYRVFGEECLPLKCTRVTFSSLMRETTSGMVRENSGNRISFRAKPRRIRSRTRARQFFSARLVIQQIRRVSSINAP